MDEPLWLKVLTAIVIGALLALIIYISDARAGPLYQASEGSVRVTLYSEECTLPAIMNLPYRAEWVENDKAVQGCWALHPAGVIVGYFADRTVVIFAASAFQKVRSI